MKKTLSALLAVSIAFTMGGCIKVKEQTGDLNESSVMSSSQSSEYPNSSSELQGHSSSSDLSSIISQISSNQSNKSNKSNQSNSSGATSSKPKPPTVTSKPSSSVPTPSKPKPNPDPSNDNINYQEMKAVWISYLEFDKFKGSSKANFTNNIKTFFNKSKSKGLNTVIVQIRAHGDSFFESAYYPWSRHVSGTVGEALSYDPMEIIIKEAHSRGLSVHAWINPYRTMTDTEFKSVSNTFKTKQWYTGVNNNYMIKNPSDGRWWLKPGKKEVQNLIIDGAKEIVRKYDVDGMHIDDYFYAAAPSVYGDTTAQAKANTTAMVKGLYSGIKSVNKNCLFGVSPAGGFPTSQALPDSDRKYLSTDLKKWCQNSGYIDYVMPQIYWDYNHPTAGYAMVLEKWRNFVTSSSVQLYSGIAAYKVSSNGIKKESIPKQIADSFVGKSNGYAIYRYDHLDDY